MEISKKEVTTARCVITQNTTAVSNFAAEAWRNAFDTVLKFCLKFAKHDRHFELKLYMSYSQHLRRNFCILDKKTFPTKSTCCIVTQEVTILPPIVDTHFTVNITCAESPLNKTSKPIKIFTLLNLKVENFIFIVHDTQ